MWPPIFEQKSIVFGYLFFAICVDRWRMAQR